MSWDLYRYPSEDQENDYLAQELFYRHPGLETLVEYSCGLLDYNRYAELLEHCAVCEECSDVVMALESRYGTPRRCPRSLTVLVDSCFCPYQAVESASGDVNKQARKRFGLRMGNCPACQCLATVAAQVQEEIRVRARSMVILRNPDGRDHDLNGHT